MPAVSLLCVCVHICAMCLCMCMYRRAEINTYEFVNSLSVCTLYLSATTLLPDLSAACSRCGLAELLVALNVLSTWEVQAVERMELCSLENNAICKRQSQIWGSSVP